MRIKKELQDYIDYNINALLNSKRDFKAIYEIMPISAAIRRILHETVTAEKIEEATVSEGMNTLRLVGTIFLWVGLGSIAIGLIAAVIVNGVKWK